MAYAKEAIQLFFPRLILFTLLSDEQTFKSKQPDDWSNHDPYQESWHR